MFTVQCTLFLRYGTVNWEIMFKLLKMTTACHIFHRKHKYKHKNSIKNTGILSINNEITLSLEYILILATNEDNLASKPFSVLDSHRCSFKYLIFRQLFSQFSIIAISSKPSFYVELDI